MQSFGRLITKEEAKAIFGDDGKGGIVVKDGKVHHIYATIGSGKKYPNEVNGDILKYCYSPSSVCNTAMKKAYDNNERIKIKLAPDRSTATYYWGDGLITTLKEVIQHSGKEMCRFVIDRSTKKRRLDEDGIQKDIPLQDESLEQPTSTMDSVNPVNRVSKFGDDVLDALHPVDPSDWSLLEVKHALFMKFVGIPWQDDPPTFHFKKHGIHYTPDFLVHLGSEKFRCILEIKPCYPYDSEIWKCTEACCNMGLPVILLYGGGRNGQFHCPFKSKPEESGKQGSYAHADGVRGMRFELINGQVQVTHDVCYTVDRNGVPTIAPRSNISDMNPYSEVIMDAYKRVNTLVE